MPSPGRMRGQNHYNQRRRSHCEDGTEPGLALHDALVGVFHRTPARIEPSGGQALADSPRGSGYEDYLILQSKIHLTQVSFLIQVSFDKRPIRLRPGHFAAGRAARHLKNEIARIVEAAQTGKNRVQIGIALS
jgi:hypothetical protein